MNNPEIRTTRITVVEKGKELFDESATHIEFCDEGGGEFLSVSQSHAEPGKINIDPSEWDILKLAIDQMIKECRS